MPTPAVVYLLLATVLLLFLALSETPQSNPAHRHRTRRLSSSFHHYAISDDESRSQLQAKVRGPRTFRDIQESLEAILDDGHWENNPEKLVLLEELFGQDGKLNITERLMYLFPLLDRHPKDGFVSFRELEIWYQRKAMDRLIHNTEKEMDKWDKDGDWEVSLREFLAGDRHGKPIEWWQKLFVIADVDETGSLNEIEFNHFLHPEDSKEPRIETWLLEQKMRDMDQDKDGRLSFTEFNNHVDEIFKNYAPFEKELHKFYQPNAEKTFAKLDVNQDGYVTVEELRPIFLHLWPGELSHATYFSQYLIQMTDDDGDGNINLKEMLEHHNTFYTTVFQESHHDDDDDFYDFQDELR